MREKKEHRLPLLEGLRWLCRRSVFIQRHIRLESAAEKGKFSSLISCLDAKAEAKRERRRLFSAANRAQLGRSTKWHYEKCCIETLFVLAVIARVFNVIAAIYFQVAYQQGGSVYQVHKFTCERMRVCACLCDLFIFGTSLGCTLDSLQTHKLLQGETRRVAEGS